MPEFSIVIPVYNAESTLDAAINSVLKQTYNNWELIIVDDCSTDNSLEMARRYSERDVRIRTICLKHNSGNAKRPIDEGVKEAKGTYCVILYDDDEIESDYLRIMQNNIKDGADVVLPVMVVKIPGRDGEYGRIPNNEPLFVSYTGRDACKLTLPEWELGCNGMAFRRELYNHVFEQNNYFHMNSDEFSERLILFYAERVVQSRAEYYFWQLQTSITHKKTTKLYESLYVDEQLMEFAKMHYDEDQIEKVFSYAISRLMVLQKDYYRDKNLYSDEEKEKIRHILDEAFAYLQDITGVKKSVKEKFLLSNAILFRLICRTKL